MRAVVTKTGQTREKRAGLQEMGVSDVTVAGRSSSLLTSSRSRIGGSPRNKRTGSKGRCGRTRAGKETP